MGKRGYTILELLLCVFFLAIVGAAISTCWGGCAGSKEVCIKEGCFTFEPYGLFDEDSVKNDQVEYEVSTGNVVLSVIFVESVVVPVILLGWYLYEPVGVADSAKPKGAS